MLAALAAGFPDDEWRAFVPGGRGGAVGGGAALPGVEVVRGRLSSRLVFGSAALTGRPTLDSLLGGDLDVAWIPAPAPVAVSRDVPYVLTVHDLSWVEDPYWYTRYERLWHRLGRLPQLAREARIVVAVSAATKRKIEERWPSVEDVRVIHSGVPALPQPGPRPEWLPERYFLAVGALEPRKAPGELASAWARARRGGLDAELVFAGRGRLAGVLRAFGATVVKDADRATLATLYANALALALPSYDEGFGFTALEAASVGTPVLGAEGLAVLDETLGDAARRVPRGAWEAALFEIARDDAERRRLGAAGAQAAARFTWRSAAATMRGVLEEAAR